MLITELSHNDVLKLLPEREKDTHKGHYGKVLLLCGSRGYTGAAALAAMGALRVGAGLVYLGVPESIYAIEAIKLLEPVVFSLPDERGAFSENAIDQISKILPKVDVILIGCGMGCSTGTEAVTKYVLESFCGPVVVDADGINVLINHKDILRGRTNPTIITPHEGEFVRFAQRNLEFNRLDSALDLARELGIIVVLKGYQTITTDGVAAYMNISGNPGMAVGGCGDVLAGMIAGLIGQGIATLEATACAVWLHGAAGDICAQEIGQYGMLPGDMLQIVPRLMK